MRRDHETKWITIRGDTNLRGEKRSEYNRTGHDRTGHDRTGENKRGM